MSFDNVWMAGEVTREGRRAHRHLHIREDADISDG
jgi:hypothetical protein